MVSCGVKRKWFLPDQKSCLILLKTNMWMEANSTQAHLAEEDTHLMIYPFSFFFLVFARGCVLCSAQESEGGERILNQATKGVHC